MPCVFQLHNTGHLRTMWPVMLDSLFSVLLKLKSEDKSFVMPFCTDSVGHSALYYKLLLSDWAFKLVDIVIWFWVIIEWDVFRWMIQDLKCFRAWHSRRENTRASSANVCGFLAKGQQQVEGWDREKVKASLKMLVTQYRSHKQVEHIRYLNSW